ncbi:MAG: DUF4376 domain-containing protein [Desulfobacterales bacterium]|nr:DUF4376 domain-containing protein [Desulfobacterales bacterium]
MINDMMNMDFDFEEVGFTSDVTYDLDTEKRIRCDEVENVMQSKIGSGIEVGGDEFKTDERSLTSISRAYSHAINSKMNNATYETEWSKKDGTPVILDADGMIELGEKAFQKVDVMYRKARVVKSLVRELETIEEVKTFNIFSSELWLD